LMLILMVGSGGANLPTIQLLGSGEKAVSF
jgi:hypothetical protein